MFNTDKYEVAKHFVEGNDEVFLRDQKFGYFNLS